MATVTAPRPADTDLRDLITVKEAARRLGVPPQTVYKMTWKGRLPSVRLGRTRRMVRVPASHVETYLESR